MNPFGIGNRYEKIGLKVNKHFSEEKYYQEAMLLELCYLSNIVGIKLEIDGKISYTEEKSASLEKVLEAISTEVSNDKGFKQYIFPRIKELEQKYNHDIVAVQYTVMDFIKEADIYLGGIKNENLVHWGLTSQDIVNTVYTKMVRDYINSTFEESFFSFTKSFESFCSDDVLILGKTHGQSALPMSIKHIFTVFSDRFFGITEDLHSIDIKVKFGNGAIGNNFSQNLFEFDFSRINLKTVQQYFGSRFDYMLDERTFQNNNYPYINNVFHQMHKICTVLKDLSVDMWLYSSMGYIKKKFAPLEHGSSTMPQKSNPIEFENAEGNLEMAIGLLEIYMRKLNSSRLQRDLSDLTMMRSIGMIFCYIEKSLESLTKAFNKFEWDRDGISLDYKRDSYNHMREFIQLREKLISNGMSYEYIKNMEGEDVLDYLRKNIKHFIS